MSRPISRDELVRTHQLASSPAIADEPSPDVRKALKTRHFDLPVALHAGFFGLFLAYLAVMYLGFRSPGMVIPMAIFVVFTVAFYAVPALWSGMEPEHADRPARLADLLATGMATHTGWCRGRDAVAQVMLMPLVLLGWGITVVTIAALV